jgi:hypothetical protein
MVRSSIEIVKDIEDPYRIEAFKVVLLHLLNYPGGISPKAQISKKTRAPSKAQIKKPRGKTTLRADVKEKLMKMEDERFDDISHLRGKRRYFLLLKIAKDKGIDGLSPAEIGYILQERFMLTGIHETNIGRDLRKSTGLVEKFKLDNGHGFKIKKEGEDYINGEIEGLKLKGKGRRSRS